MKKHAKRLNGGIDELFGALENYFMIDRADMLTSSRRRALVDARKLYSYVAHVCYKRPRRLIAIDLHTREVNVRYYVRDVAVRTPYVHEYKDFLRKFDDKL